MNTVASSVEVEAYRIGWYQGYGARLVAKLGRARGVVQAQPSFTPTVNMIECHWRETLRFDVGDDWPSGYYLLKLIASNGYSQWVPLVVRDDSSRAAVLVQSSVTTWQAYNLWGGYSLYGTGPGGYGYAGPIASRLVRPAVPGELGERFGRLLRQRVPARRPAGAPRRRRDLLDRPRPPRALAPAREPPLPRQPRPRRVLVVGHEIRRAGAPSTPGSTSPCSAPTAATATSACRTRRSARPGARSATRTGQRIPLYGVDNAEVTSNWEDGPVTRARSPSSSGWSTRPTAAAAISSWPTPRRSPSPGQV